jgi:hypothetical protein
LFVGSGPDRTKAANWGALLLTEIIQLAINPQLRSASCQKLNPGFDLAGLDLVADLELPFPDARHSRGYDGIVHAFVYHRRLSVRDSINLEANGIRVCFGLLTFAGSRWQRYPEDE